MTGESLYEDDDQELDEDYLDPRYLHSAAELYDNPELFYEMQGQLESAHGEGRVNDPLGYELEIGRNYDNFDTDIDGDPALVGMGGAYRPMHQMPGYEEDESIGQTLSPRQYAMLMNSMQDPLSMYASSLRADDPNGRISYHEGRQSAQQGSAMIDQRMQEYNPLDMYSRGLYNTSPMYTDNEPAQVEDFDGVDDYSDHPAFAMMNAGYNEQSNFDVGLGAGPRPPTRYGS